MALALTLFDETTSGNTLGKCELTLVSQRMTLRELLAERIRTEVERFNQQRNQEIFQGFVQPSDAEKALNGYKLRKPRSISFEKQMALAVRAFETNGFFVLLNDQQISGLEEMLTLDANSKISFIKLVPLVGG